MKTCPFCAEAIRDAAIVCKHCKRELPSPQAAVTINCPFCNAVVPRDSRVCPACGDNLSGLSEAPARTKSTNGTKKISETKCTCSSCGGVWHYGKAEALQSAGAALQNAGKSMMCCTGCVPALFIPDRQVVDLNKCPKCGSKAVKKETVEHDVP
jgi:RNA polymerase subunit RPABC4/transcription elongation factor Spt4